MLQNRTFCTTVALNGDPTSPHLSAAEPFDKTAPRRDVQNEKPRVTATLSRVGVTNVEKIVRIGSGDDQNLFHAKLDCFVDLAAAQKGVHMSRFEEVVNEAIEEVVLGGEAFRAEILAGRLAEIIRERQGGARAEVSHRGALPRAQARAGQRRATRRRSTRCSAPPLRRRAARASWSACRRRA